MLNKTFPLIASGSLAPLAAFAYLDAHSIADTTLKQPVKIGNCALDTGAEVTIPALILIAPQMAGAPTALGKVAKRLRIAQEDFEAATPKPP